LSNELRKSGYPCCALHGGVDQYDRDSYINDFKQGNVKLLVATSVAARGLDVRDLCLVVNFDTPNHYEDYVHRVGRTGRAGSAGTCWTLITQDDAKYSGDIVFALQQSKKIVPDALQKLWDDYKAEMKKAGKKIYRSSGFANTRGFKFDETEENAIKEQRQMQKVSLGLDEGDDDKAINSSIDIDKQIEEKFKIKKRTRTKEHYAPLPLEQLMKKKEMEGRELPTSAKVEDLKQTALDISRKINARLNATKSKKEIQKEKREQQTYGKNTGATPVSAREIAEQMAAKLNKKVGYSGPGASITDKLEKKEAEEKEILEFEEALEINDFPQSVRFRCCQRDTLTRLNEEMDCRITVRGRYYEEDGGGPTEEDEDPRLYLEVIADSEMKVARCRSEIKRVVKEELLKIQARPLSNLTKSAMGKSSIGRYKIGV